MIRTFFKSRIFETRYFGFIIGAAVVLVLSGLRVFTLIPERMELKMLDLHFSLKEVVRGQSAEEGVVFAARNPNISPDILILGVDFNSLSRFGKWPFPRYRHANLLDGLSRIQNQDERERAVFLDFFFIEPDEKAYDDAILVESIRNNGRVFLETVLELNPPPAGMEGEFFGREKALYETFGSLEGVQGAWDGLTPFLGLQPPLKPYGTAGRGYGHANYLDDFDKIYRRQVLVARSSELVETLLYEELTPEYPLRREENEWLGWFDTEGRLQVVPHPLSTKVLAELGEELRARAPRKTEDDPEGQGSPRYLIRKYRDHFVPSITLSLALEYFNKSFSDLDIVIGKHIRIPRPQYFDRSSGEWVPYTLELKPPRYDEQGQETRPGVYREMDEILIPIDKNGEMLVNYMGIPSSASPGGHQTFPVRSYAEYASRVPGWDPDTWPRTKALGNKIVMVGPFAEGMAADQKPTPHGLMYGVEIHANALNTILMNKFLTYAPAGVNSLILLGLVFVVVFFTSRHSTLWSFVMAVGLVLAYFLAVSLTFERYAFILDFSSPALGLAFSFVGVVVYRAMTEEKDKRRIRDMFGKYVSPMVVDQILQHPPELGGVDKELTVFFSDIRGFTTLSENLSPQELVNHLNIYLSTMTDLILEYQGTLDKYVGDEIMCFWGAPLPQSDHAFLACKCALRQMQALKELNDSWPRERRLDIGIGINSGIMTVGNMGSLGRMNYTLMGDNVNLGARLEGTNKQYGTNVIISEYTYGLVKDRIVARELDNIRVKGKNRPVVIYELIDVTEGLEAPKLPGSDGKKKGS